MDYKPQPQPQQGQVYQQDTQYSGVVYTEQTQQQQYQQQQQQQQYAQQQQYTQNALITPLPPIQPDPLPKALTQTQVEIVTAQQVATLYPGARMDYVPQLVSEDHFHSTMCGCVTDFFTCKHMSTCCCGFWCPCALYARIHYRLRARNPQDLNGYSYCTGECWASACFGTPIHSRQRDEIRHRYKLYGSCCGDCMRHTFCSPCTLCQEEKEIIYRDDELQNLIKAANYQKAPQMVYPSQTKA